MSEKVIIVKENTLESWLSDIVTFGSIVASFWFNYKFIGGNDMLDVLLFIAFFFMAIGKAGNYKKLKELEKS